jgi:hypothetical protein
MNHAVRVYRKEKIGKKRRRKSGRGKGESK